MWILVSFDCTTDVVNSFPILFSWFIPDFPLCAKLILFVMLCTCVLLCVCACEYSCPRRSEAMGALELKVETVGSCLTCVLRVQLGPSGRTVCLLNCRVASPAPIWGCFQEKKKKTTKLYHSCLVCFFLFCFNIYSSGC